MTATLDEIMAPWIAADVVPLPDLAERAGVTWKARREAVDAGLITPVSEPGRGHKQMITKEDALRLALAALLAVAAGLAVVTVLRVLAATGAEVGPGGVKIPMPGP